jgi:hypothetical protein
MPPEGTDNLNGPTPNPKDPTWTTIPRHRGQVRPAPYSTATSPLTAPSAAPRTQPPDPVTTSAIPCGQPPDTASTDPATADPVTTDPATADPVTAEATAAPAAATRTRPRDNRPPHTPDTPVRPATTRRPPTSHHPATGPATTPPRTPAATAGERGAATAETVLAIPAVLLLILLIVQLAVWQHATHLAQAAAEHALNAARVQGGTAADGRAAAQQFLRPATGPLRAPTLTIDRGATTITVTLDATAEPIIPGLRLPIHARAVGPAEPAPPPGNP